MGDVLPPFEGRKKGDIVAGLEKIGSRLVASVDDHHHLHVFGNPHPFQ